MKTKNKIQKTLGISEAEWNDVFLDSGTITAEVMGGGKTWLSETLKTCNTYWMWYSDQFDIKDRRFLATYNYDGNNQEVINTLVNLWKKSHQNGLKELLLPTIVLKQAIKEKELV